MVIISRPQIEAFIRKNPLSASSLNTWYFKTKEANWGNPNEIKLVFPACDYIGNDRYVFNIGGNNYRLVAMIHFSKRTLYIRGIFIHADYEELSNKGLLQAL
ncbi:MAG: type II toxin-antitoxin system HigB family toxin [Bacteroidota bacterium]